MHVNAQKQAEASECAYVQGGEAAYWKFIDTLFARTKSGGTGFDNNNLVPLAKELGLNANTFKTCLDNGEQVANVKAQMDGGTQAGVSGTPGNILLNTKTGKTRLIPGAVPFEQIKVAIDEMLKS
jgi:protein-disulfide isomerase